MGITINQNCRAYVEVGEGGIVVTHGFDQVFRRCKEFVHHLGKHLGEADPRTRIDPAKIGTIEQYEQFKALQDELKHHNVNDTWYSHGIDQKLIQVFERLRASGEEVRVWQGHVTTGRAWIELDHADCIGRISRSSGSMKIPLLIGRDGYDKGTLFDHSCLRIVRINDAKELWRHPLFHVPYLSIVPNDDPQSRDEGFEWVVLADNDGKYERVACFKDIATAGVFVAVTRGDILDMKTT